MSSGLEEIFKVQSAQLAAIAQSLASLSSKQDALSSYQAALTGRIDSLQVLKGSSSRPSSPGTSLTSNDLQGYTPPIFKHPSYGQSGGSDTDSHRPQSASSPQTPQLPLGYGSGPLIDLSGDDNDRTSSTTNQSSRLGPPSTIPHLVGRNRRLHPLPAVGSSSTNRPIVGPGKQSFAGGISKPSHLVRFGRQTMVLCIPDPCFVNEKIDLSGERFNALFSLCEQAGLVLHPQILKTDGGDSIFGKLAQDMAGANIDLRLATGGLAWATRSQDGQVLIPKGLVKSVNGQTLSDIFAHSHCGILYPSIGFGDDIFKNEFVKATKDDEDEKYFGSWPDNDLNWRPAPSNLAGFSQCPKCRGYFSHIQQHERTCRKRPSASDTKPKVKPEPTTPPSKRKKPYRGSSASPIILEDSPVRIPCVPPTATSNADPLRLLKKKSVAPPPVRAPTRSASKAPSATPSSCREEPSVTRRPKKRAVPALSPPPPNKIKEAGRRSTRTSQAAAAWVESVAAAAPLSGVPQDSTTAVEDGNIATVTPSDEDSDESASNVV